MMQTVQDLTNGRTINEAITALGNELKARTGGVPLRFAFHWAGYPFKGSLTPHKSGTGEIEITARLGTLPFSAENARARQKGLDLLSCCEEDSEICFQVTSTGEVQCSTSTTFESNLSAVTMAEVLTITLLHLRKHLKYFDGILVPMPRRQKRSRVTTRQAASISA